MRKERSTPNQLIESPKVSRNIKKINQQNVNKLSKFTTSGINWKAIKPGKQNEANIKFVIIIKINKHNNT